MDVALDLLDKYKRSSASFTIHLYETHFKFENQVCPRVLSSSWLILADSLNGTNVEDTYGDDYLGWCLFV
jgi:hypothetical protein